MTNERTLSSKRKSYADKDPRTMMYGFKTTMSDPTLSDGKKASASR